MTNFEKIKSDIQDMETAEQLVDSQYACVGWHCGYCEYESKEKCGEDVSCFNQYLKWLKSEVDNDTT